MILDPATVLALAIACAPAVDPYLVLAIARTESGLHTDLVHANTNGTADFGLMQINQRNFAWLGIDPQSAMDPCVSIRAGVRVLTSMSAYNTGNPTAGIGYAQRVVTAYDEARGDGARPGSALSPHAAPAPQPRAQSSLASQFTLIGR